MITLDELNSRIQGDITQYTSGWGDHLRPTVDDLCLIVANNFSKLEREGLSVEVGTGSLTGNSVDRLGFTGDCTLVNEKNNPIGKVAGVDKDGMFGQVSMKVNNEPMPKVES